MENKEKAYNEIVGLALVNFYSLSRDKEYIGLDRFDICDEEHLFFLAVALTSYGIHQHPVRVNCSRRDRKKLAKMFGNTEIFHWTKRAKRKESTNINDMADFMRPVAAEITQDEIFTFGDIYHEFYERKEDNA